MSLPRAKFIKNFPGCPVEATLGFLDGKWKGVILFHLMQGTLRFNELRRKLPAVTQRMLTKQLRELEQSGLVSRTVYPVVPPHVDYAMTPLGMTLKPVVDALAAWGDDYVFCSPEGRELRMASDGLYAPARRSSRAEAAKTNRPRKESAAPT